MAKQVMAWKCNYCNFLFMRRTDAEKHEDMCRNNPDSKDCCVCTHNIIKTDKNYRNGKDVVSCSYCKKYEKNVKERPYHIDCEHNQKGNPIDRTCKSFEYKRKELGPAEERRKIVGTIATGSDRI